MKKGTHSNFAHSLDQSKRAFYFDFPSMQMKKGTYSNFAHTLMAGERALPATLATNLYHEGNKTLKSGFFFAGVTLTLITSDVTVFKCGLTRPGGAPIATM